MAQKEYAWERFWCPREGRLYEDGAEFLADPTGKYGHIYNPDSVPFEKIASTRCLVLLGEPGIGKSHEVGKIFGRVKESARGQGDMTLMRDLKPFQTDHSFRTEFFRGETLSDWKTTSGELHLFLDSLDECLMRIDNVTAIIEEELQQLPTKRLLLRIACRTADWPITFEEHLRQVFGKDNVRVFELMPLRECDVEAAAADEGIDSVAFMEAVYHHNAVPLARKPITLRMLMGLFRNHGSFPDKQFDLYEKGCLLMCEEHDESRRKSSRLRRSPANELLAVASRIAAVTLFCNKAAVWTAPDMGDIPVEDVAASDLTGGVEPLDGSPVEAAEALVLEAVGTGLFSSRGPHRMGWAHRTYEEFLAARYLAKHSMTDDQVLSLLVHPDDPGGRLVPQLHETAAWVAGSNNGIFSYIMGREPEVLLRSDVAARDDNEKARLVSAILGLYDRGLTIDRFGLIRDFSRLSHATLAAQLRPYIVRKDLNASLREVAIDIAQACALQDVMPDIVAVALDTSDLFAVRVGAAYAIRRAGDDSAKSRLRPLLFEGAGPDPDDELKGCALHALWPSHITAEELFNALTPPKNSSLVGAYSAFIYDLSEKLAGQLTVADLPVALDWASSHVAERDELVDMTDSIMHRAWKELPETPAVAPHLAAAALARLRHYRPVLKDESGKPIRDVFIEDEKRRRLLLSSVVKLPDITEEDASRLAYGETPLVTPDDLAYLLSLLRVEACQPRKSLLARLIRDMFLQVGCAKPGNDSLVLEARSLCPERTDLFSFFDPVMLDSPAARKTKADYLRTKRLEKRFARLREKPLLVPSPIERVLALLDKFDAGDLNAWWHICLEMTLEPNDRYYNGGRELNPDVADLPVWTAADEQTRERLIAAAKVYVLAPTPMDCYWLGTNVFDFPATAGYKAILLLAKEEPGIIETFPDTAWKKWAPVVVSYPLGTEYQEPFHVRIMALAYHGASNEVLNALVAEIRGDISRSEYLSMSPVDRLDSSWDDRIASTLYDEMLAIKDKPKAAAQLLSKLVEKQYAPAITYANKLLTLPLPSDGPRRVLALEATEALSLYALPEQWPAVWTAIQSDEAFGRELLEKLPDVDHVQKSAWFAHLSVPEVAALFEWLARHYPYRSTDHGGGHGAVSPIQHGVWLRDTILKNLMSRGTREACGEISRIAEAFPQYEWLKRTVQRAESNYRRASWTPPKPTEVIRLASDSARRYVESGERLLTVIVESLTNLDERLHGTPAAVEDLWDNRGNAHAPKWMPKDEAHLSDYVVRHLQDHIRDRGIVVNREVEIRRGDETDIHVNAISPPGRNERAEIISAVVEVKGCWHPELKTAMQDQLLNRYLTDNPSPHGLYLVGWFNCEDWSNEDSREAQAPKKSLTWAREFFAKRAEELSRSAALPGLILRSYVLNTALMNRKKK